jgi:hypothetical protein
MPEESQIFIPASFIALYLPAGRIKPTSPRDVIAARYELCEDLACQLVDYAKNTHLDLGVSEDEVLDRCHRGLAAEASGMSEPEAAWIIRRLAELIGWECPPMDTPH